MGNGNIKVSVYVLTYNQQDTIARTLNSILSQDHSYSMEIVIGEDCSTDNTRSICMSFAEKYPNIIRLLPQEPNKGLLKNFTDTLKTCRGEYLAGCAGDDWWHNPDKLKLQIDFMDRNKEFVLTHSDIDIYYKGENRIIKSLNKTSGRKIPSGDFTKYLLADIIPIYTPTPCFRRSSLQYFDIEQIEKLGFLMEDLPLWLNLCRIGKFYYMDQSLATYTISEGSVCRPKDEMERLTFIESIASVQNFFYENYFKEKISYVHIVNAGIKRKFYYYVHFERYSKAFNIIKELQVTANPKILILKFLSCNYFVFRFAIMVKTILISIKKIL